MFIIFSSLTISFSEEETLISLKIYLKLLNAYDGDCIFMGVTECVEGDVRKQKYCFKAQTTQAPSKPLTRLLVGPLAIHF